MKTIPLTKGFFTKVDDDDYTKFAVVRWQSFLSECGHVRAVTKEPITRKTVYLSRKIMDAPTGMYVDHINGDTLDNRKQNLRLCTNQQNTMNSKLNRKNNKSGFKGVSWSRIGKKWIGCLKFNNKPIHLGYFSQKEDAARAYDVASKRYFGKFGKLNFVD